MALKDYLEKAANVGMGALETINAPFQVAGETIRAAGESEPMKMATAADPSGYRWPSIVQRWAPSTRTPLPPADPFTKAYQGLEGIVSLPWGLQAASNVVKGQPDLAAQIGGMGLALGLMPPVAKTAPLAKAAPVADLSEELASIAKPLTNEAETILPKSKSTYFPPGSPERAANFKNWFGESKVVDETGKPITAYRGDFRGDLIKGRLQKGKMSSGRFYFTEDPEIASNYAKGKPYIEDSNYENWFKVGTGRSKDNLDNAWYKLSPEQQARVKDTFMRAYKDDETGEIKFGEANGGLVDPDHWKWALREAQGNWLKAGKETWLNSGALFDDEEQFGKILDKAGVPFHFDNPYLGHQTVTPVNLAIKNPIDSGNPPKDFIDAVTQWAKRSRKKPALHGEDAWDKNLRDPKEYAAELQRAAENGTDLWTTSIPDEVVKIAQKLGYDGIKDTGGKYGGTSNKQWIAFEPTQIKSTMGNRGTFSPTNPNITRSIPVAAGIGAAGAAAKSEAEAEEPQYAEGGIVEDEESEMPFKSQAQRKYMYANHPEIAQEFESETPEGADLPEYKPMNQGGVAGDWRDELAGQLDQQYGDHQDQPQSMADGGFAGDSYDVDTGGTSTIRGLPLSPAMTPGLPPAAPAPLTFNPRAGLPPVSPSPTPIAAAPITPTPVAPNRPDPLQMYLSEQKQKLNRYGPEEQMALEQSLDKQRRGLLPNLALAGTGLADAIMQGVARAGSSNFQSNLQNRMDKTQEGQRQAFESGRAGHMAKMKQEMELAQMDPTSPISRLAQRTASPLLREIGLSDEEIQNIPASLVGDVQTKGLSLEEIRSRAELARAVQENTAEYQQELLSAGRRKEQTEAAEKTAERQYRAAKDIEAKDKAPKAKIFGSEIPYWTSPVSRKERRAYRDVIRGQAAGERTVSTPTTSTPPITQVNSREEWEALEPGTPYTDSNGKYGVKK